MSLNSNSTPVHRANPRGSTFLRARKGLLGLVASSVLAALLSTVGGVASAAPDPVKDAKATLAHATSRRLVSEGRIGEIKTRIQELDRQLAEMDAAGEQMTRDLAEAKNDMRQFAISAYIDGRKADVVAASLDPASSQTLMWQSTLSVGQSASAEEVAHRYEDLKAAATPRRLSAAQNLEDSRRALTDANNDAIQAAALERDAEAALEREQQEARRRAEEAKARAAEAKARARAAAAAARSVQASNSAGPTAAAPVGHTPAATSPAPSEVPAPSSGLNGNPSPVESATLAKIRRCESHGNYGIVSASGRYRGAYQFDHRTWAGLGGSGDPAAASPAEQDYRALLLLRSRGTRPWPVCGR